MLLVVCDLEVDAELRVWH